MRANGAAGSNRSTIPALVAGISLGLGLVPAPDLQAQDVDPEIRSGVESLVEHPLVQQAFAAVEALDPRAVDDLITLTQVPAPPFMEAERGAVYADWLAEAGADSVWVDEVGNVLALRRGRVGARTIGFGGHLDTVFPEGTDVTVRQRGDTLFAPGIGDDTRGLIVVLTVLFRETLG